MRLTTLKLPRRAGIQSNRTCGYVIRQLVIISVEARRSTMKRRYHASYVFDIMRVIREPDLFLDLAPETVQPPPRFPLREASVASTRNGLVVNPEASDSNREED